MCISAHLASQLEEYIEEHLSGVVRLIRTKRREGLIRARIFGADCATGDVSNCRLLNITCFYASVTVR